MAKCLPAGILAPLLSLQRLDVHDVEGIGPLCASVCQRLQVAATSEPLRGAQGTQQNANSDAPSNAEWHSRHQECEQSSQSAGAAAAIFVDAHIQAKSEQGSPRHEAVTRVHRGPEMTQEQLLQLPMYEAYAAIREYLIAATAKDCSLMLCMQRLVPAGQPGMEVSLQDAACLPRQHAHEDNVADAAAHQELGSDLHPEQPKQVEVEGLAQMPAHDCNFGGADVGAICGDYRQMPWPSESSVGLQGSFRTTDGSCFGYALVVVDLDKKAAAKIPKHQLLDQEMMRLHARLSCKPLAGLGT